MLKASLKVNIILQLDDGEPDVPGNAEAPALNEQVIAARFLRDAEHAKYKLPLQMHFAGLKALDDKAAAERLMEALERGLTTMCAQLSITQHPGGEHVPDLALAKGGLPEPKPDGGEPN